MVDYRKFLGGSKETVLYLGGSLAYGAAAPVRLREPAAVEPGFYLAERSGRYATLASDAPVERLPLAGEPRAVGHFAAGYVSLEGGRFSRVMLLGEPEPDVLSRVRVVHHVAGVTLLEEALFDEDAEFAAREALHGAGALGELRGLSPTLRLAFGWALLSRVSGARGEPASPVEALGALAEVAVGGEARATEIVEALARRRAAVAGRVFVDEADRGDASDEPADVEQAVVPVWTQAPARDQRLGRGHRGRRREELLTPEDRSQDLFGYCQRALRAAGASLDHVREMSSRRHGRRGEAQHALVEVRFRFLGETFITVVDASTMQVRDAGVCLDGADDALTLESLPSAIREAHDTGSLVITRRP